MDSPDSAEPTTSPTAAVDDVVAGFQATWDVIASNDVSNWLLLLGLTLVGLVVGRVVALILRRLGGPEKERHFRSFTLHALGAPLTLLTTSIGIEIGLQALTLPASITDGTGRGLILLVVIAIFWLLIDMAAYIDVLVRRRSEASGGNYGQHLGPAIRKALRIFLVMIAALVVVETVLRQDIGAWLAGFGVVGLAISLAAQDSFKSFFGAIAIFIDKPFRVGQRIVFGGHDGIVEDIGFRSVKIRTLVGHLVTVPNAAIVNDSVQNIGERPYIRRLFTINVTYDTTPAKLREALEIVKGILAADDLREPIHQTIGGDEFPPRVYLNELSSYSIDIMVIYWYAPPNYWDYLAHGEQVNLRIIEAFNEAGIDFAFPSQTLYHAGDPGRDLRLQIESGQLPPA